MLFTVAVCAVIGLVAAHMLERGIGVVGEKEHVLRLADTLAQCANREQYLALLEKEYPPESPLWRSPALNPPGDGAASTATVERLDTGQWRVVAEALQPQHLLEGAAYAYIPAALVDAQGRGCLLEDVRLNSRGDAIVFEYYFRGNDRANGEGETNFRFFMGKRRWALRAQPNAAALP